MKVSRENNDSCKWTAAFAACDVAIKHELYSYNLLNADHVTCFYCSITETDAGMMVRIPFARVCVTVHVKLLQGKVHTAKIDDCIK